MDFGGLARHQTVQKLGSLVTHQLRVGDDTGERRVAEFADFFLIVNADDGDLLGNGQIDPVAGVDDVLSRRSLQVMIPIGLGKVLSHSAILACSSSQGWASLPNQGDS